MTFVQPPNGDVALAALDKLPETTQEIRDCCADLRVLGRKEFRNLLRWRLKVREKFGFASKKTAKAAEEEVAEVESMDEELKIAERLQELTDKEKARKKRERRKENERKQKEIIRMQLHMTAPTEIGLEQSGPNGDNSMFGLKMVDKNGAVDKIAKGKMVVLKTSDRPDHDSGFGSEESEESDDEQDRLDRELDNMYEQYQEKKSSVDAKFRAKKARKEHEDGDWEGFSADHASTDDEDELEGDSSDESSDDEGTSKKPLLTDLQGVDNKSGGLSRRAAQFFDQDIFKDIGGIPEEEEDSGDELEEGEEEIAADLDALEAIRQDTAGFVPDTDSDNPDAEEAESSDDDGFEIVKNPSKDNPWEDEPRKDGRLGTLIPTPFNG